MEASSWQRYTLKTQFPSVAGLRPGSPVRLAGIEVGSVTDTPLVGEQVEVVFEVNRAYRERTTTLSMGTLGSVLLLGESAVDITPSSSGTPIPEFGNVRAGQAAAQLADVASQANQGLSELTGLLQDIRTGRGTVGKLVTDPRTANALYASLTNLEEITARINSGEGSLGKMVRDDAFASSLTGATSNLQELTSKINRGEGTMG